MAITLTVALIFWFWLIKKKFYLNSLDPLQLLCLSEAIIVVTIYNQLENAQNANLTGILFYILPLYSLYWIVTGFLIAPLYKRALMVTLTKVANFSTARRRVLIYSLFICAFIMFFFAIVTGLVADNRIYLLKYIRPLESLVKWLFPVGVFLFLTQRYTFFWKFILLIVPVLLIFISGKSFALTLLVPISWYYFASNKPVKPLHSIAMLVALSFTMFASLTLVYGTSAQKFINLLVNRILNDSDIYLLGYRTDVIENLVIAEPHLYFVAPLIKYVTLGQISLSNVGSQIASVIAGKEVLTGPNPQYFYLLSIYYDNTAAMIFTSMLLLTSISLVKYLLLKVSFRVGPMSALLIIIQTSSSINDFFRDPGFPVIYLTQALLFIIIIKFIFDFEILRWQKSS
ncbi:hypothetical protein N9R76_01105 [Planktomarina temperata]|nr:hypothetical protein [Planktomarina temperata]